MPAAAGRERADVVLILLFERGEPFREASSVGWLFIVACYVLISGDRPCRTAFWTLLSQGGLEYLIKTTAFYNIYSAPE